MDSSLWTLHFSTSSHLHFFHCELLHAHCELWVASTKKCLVHPIIIPHQVSLLILVFWYPLFLFSRTSWPSFSLLWFYTILTSLENSTQNTNCGTVSTTSIQPKLEGVTFPIPCLSYYKNLCHKILSSLNSFTFFSFSTTIPLVAFTLLLENFLYSHFHNFLSYKDSFHTFAFVVLSWYVLLSSTS